MTILKSTFGKNIMASDGKLLSIISAPSPGQVQTIQSTGDGVSISSWIGQPGGMDTMTEIIVSGPWSSNKVGDFLLPLVLDRYPEDRGRADLLNQDKNSVAVKVRYTDQVYRIIIDDQDLTILSARVLSVTVPDTENLKEMRLFE